MDKICHNGAKLKVSLKVRHGGFSVSSVFLTRRNLINIKSCMSMVVEGSSVTDRFVVPIVFLCRNLLSLYKNCTDRKEKTHRAS